MKNIDMDVSCGKGCCSSNNTDRHEKNNDYKEKSCCSSGTNKTENLDKKQYDKLDESCCTMCSIASGKPISKQDKNLKKERVVCFGSYSLPLKRIVMFGFALALWICGIIFDHTAFKGIALVLFLGAYAIAGLPVLRAAFLNIKKGNALDENFLMSIATIGAFAIGEWVEAVGVMIFYMIGELVQEAAVMRSRKSIDALLALKPDSARVKAGEEWIIKHADDVTVGSIVLVRPGERIPLDGVITDGTGSIDSSMLTGESRPFPVSAGDEVKSGTISMDGVLTIRTIKTAENSSAAKIIELVESANQAKAKPERFISAFAKWYTPFVVIAALALAFIPPLVLPDAKFSTWSYRALVLLVISCPCALVVSVPLGYFAGIGGMSRRGIMIKGAVHLDSLHNVKYVAFDKTGTLTNGNFSIVGIETANGIDEKQLFETAMLAEKESNHPIARAILIGAKAKGIAMPQAADLKYKEVAGRGVELLFQGKTILAGNIGLLHFRNVAIPDSASHIHSTPVEAHTAVYISVDKKYYGRILIGDTIKTGAKESVSELHKLGVEKVVMFTGDSRETSFDIASQLGIETVEAELLPEDKLTRLEEFTKKGTTLFVGDGINDAPVLARADVGIAMGGGADVAVEAADVVIMTDDPRRVPEAIKSARKTRSIVIGNVVFALAAKGAFITLAAFGLANMWIALIGDVGVALIAILNSTRALK